MTGQVSIKQARNTCRKGGGGTLPPSLSSDDADFTSSSIDRGMASKVGGCCSQPRKHIINAAAAPHHLATEPSWHGLPTIVAVEHPLLPLRSVEPRVLIPSNLAPSSRSRKGQRQTELGQWKRKRATRRRGNGEALPRSSTTPPQISSMATPGKARPCQYQWVESQSSSSATKHTQSTPLSRH